MRIVVGSLALISLLVGEALWQRHVDVKRRFIRSLEILSASLGDLHLSLVTLTHHTRSATAAATRLSDSMRGKN